MGQGTGTTSKLFRSQYACVCACVCVPMCACVYARVDMCACACVCGCRKRERLGTLQEQARPPPWKAGCSGGPPGLTAPHSACPQPIKTQGSRWEGVH